VEAAVASLVLVAPSTASARTTAPRRNAAFRGATGTPMHGLENAEVLPNIVSVGGLREVRPDSISAGLALCVTSKYQQGLTQQAMQKVSEGSAPIKDCCDITETAQTAQCHVNEEIQQACVRVGSLSACALHGWRRVDC
jgi:hypothetical protein